MSAAPKPPANRWETIEAARAALEAAITRTLDEVSESLPPGFSADAVDALDEALQEALFQVEGEASDLSTLLGSVQPLLRRLAP